MSKHNIVEGLRPLMSPIENVIHLPGNARRGDVEAISKSLNRFGQHKPIVVRRTGVDERGLPVGEILIGNHTTMAARRLGWDSIAVVWVDESMDVAKARALADNRTAELGTYDDDALAAMIADVLEADEALLEDASYTLDDLEALLGETAAPADLDGDEDDEEEQPPGPNPLADRKRAEAPATRHATLSLFDRFLVPPFTVLNAREGWWQERKNTWIDLGLEGELGRDDKPRTWFLAAPQHHHHPDRPFVPYGAADERKREDDDD